jgi:hypothetical protein
MNTKSCFYPRIKVIQAISIVFLWLFAYNTASGRMCWVDFYEYPQYSGAHIRISGPISLADLRDIHGTNWESKIDSLVVGKGARTSLFEMTDFQQANTEVYLDPDYARSLGVTNEYGSQQSGLTFSAGEQVEHLGVWNFHKKAKSLIIDCMR